MHVYTGGGVPGTGCGKLQGVEDFRGEQGGARRKAFHEHVSPGRVVPHQAEGGDVSSGRPREKPRRAGE